MSDCVGQKHRLMYAPSLPKFKEDELYFSIDWFHGVLFGELDIRVFFQKLQEIDDRLCFDFWVPQGSLNHYAVRYMYQGQGFINVAYNPVPDIDNSYMACDPYQNRNYGIYIKISGDGLRFLGDKTVKQLMFYLHKTGFRCSRLDVACDIYDKFNFVVPLLCTAFRRARTKGIFESEYDVSGRVPRHLINVFEVWDEWRQAYTTNITVGNHKSKKYMFRLYNKYVEVHSGRLKKYSQAFLDRIPSDYWYRFEFELRFEYADLYFHDLATGQVNLPFVFQKCCENFRVVELSRTHNFNNVSANPHAQAWVDFLAVLAVLSKSNDSVLAEVAPLQNSPFVQFGFDTKSRVLKYMNRMSKVLFTAMLICNVCPDIFKDLFVEGRRRFVADPSSFQSLFEFINTHVKGCDELTLNTLYHLIYSAYFEMR